MTTKLSPLLPDSANRPVRWAGLYAAGFGLTMAKAAEQHDGVMIIALANPRQLQILETELQFFLGGDSQLPVMTFPDWETLAYDIFSPHQEIISNRLRLLARLPELRRGIVLTTTENLLQRLPPIDFILGHSFQLKTGERIDIAALRSRLQHVGYHAVNQVLTQGEYAIRGGLIDLFPMGTDKPFRLDLFDDEIETIRYFDPDTQKSIENVKEIELLPAREVPLTDEGIRTFRAAFRAQFEGDPAKQTIYEEVSAGNSPPGIEYYLPLFFENTATLLDYTPDNSLILLEGDHQDQVSKLLAETRDRYRTRCHDVTRKVLPPEAIFLNQADYSAALARRPRITMFTRTSKNVDWTAPCRPPADYPVDIKADTPYQLFADQLKKARRPILIAVETAGRREALEGILFEHSVKPEVVSGWSEFTASNAPLGITVAALERGLKLAPSGVEIITESQLYGDKIFQRRQRKKSTAPDPEAIIRSLAELQLGAPVVHMDHGVGRYRGLKLLDLGEFKEEFLTVEYQNSDKLYVPIQSLHLISRFVGGDPELAPLHKLGSPQWERAKKKAQEKSYDVATELLELEASRNARQGYKFEVPPREYRKFKDRFEFEETPDQERAINEVIADMISDKPMDRLVCGDVGFGKTEVALRAAFVAVQSQKQVVMLVPTTLLATQHFESFQNRFADMAISVELLSRFTTKKKAVELVARFKKGYPDIIIGTHRLIQDDIRFQNLGLLIIDEEHRFGVRQKEKLKKLRNQVDILTLTATPIPRTLNMTMSGLREISIIATPPDNRLAIKTFVMKRNDGIIREACLREIHRGGQMYFLHNEVKTIQRTAEELQELIPEAKVEFAHGQMGEVKLERVMRDFYHQKFNLLVASTIIESGIDVPSANTIIINRADKFGLAQLHQLRGRVGRSHHQAFAYLLIPGRKQITRDANKRLDAIEQLEDLGAGFSLASHDLEIRGAGELLGETQSGLIDDVGFTLYTEYLDRAIRAMKEGKEISRSSVANTQQTEVSMDVPALFPDDYLSDIHMRLVMYKRIASAENQDELKELEIETIDRFGLMPDAAKNLFHQTAIKIKATPIGISKIDLDEDGGKIEFIPEPAVDVSAIIGLIQKDPRTFKLDRTQALLVDKEMEEPQQRFAFIENLIGALRATI